MASPAWNYRARLRESGEGPERAIFAAAIAVLILIAIITLFFLVRRERGPQAPREAPAAAEIDLQAPSEKAPEAEVAQKAPEMESPGAPPAAGTKEEAQPKAEEAPGGSVSGTVRVAGTVEFAPGVVVAVRQHVPSGDDLNFIQRLKAMALEEGDRSAVSGSDGRYSIGGIPIGEYRIFALRGETDFIDIAPAMGKRLTVGPDLADQTVDIEVSHGGTIFGKVLDGDEKPIAGARVAAPSRDFLGSVFDTESGFGGIAEVVAKEDGSYRIAGLPLEKSYLVIAQATDKAKAVSEEISFSDEERTMEVFMILLVGSTVSGRVIGPGGEPVEGVNTWLNTEAQSLLLLDPHEMKTDASGAFRFEHISAGSYLLKASDATGKEVVQTVECDGETDVSDIVLALGGAAPEAESLFGRVVDDTGAAVPGAQLQLSGIVITKGPVNMNTTSQADGSFAFKGVPQGMFTLMVTHEKYAMYTKVGAALGPNALEVVLQRTARVSGSIVTTAGDPVAGALVKLTPIVDDASDLTRLMAGQIPGQIPSAKSGPDGAFVLEKVVSGRARLRAEASGFAPGLSKEFEIAAGQEIGDVSVALSEGGSIAGVVLSPEGKPVGDVRVMAREVSSSAFENQIKMFMPAGLGGGSTPSSRAEDDGTFKIDHLPEGKFILTATHGDFSPPADVEISLRPDERREGIKLRLRKLSTLRVKIREKEKPISDLMVQVLGVGPMRMSTSDLDGRAEFAGLAPGDYLVQIMDMAKMLAGQGLGMRQKAVSVAEGQTAEVDIVLGVGAKINGKVIGKLPGSMNVVVITRPGAPKAEEMDIGDFQASIRAAQHNIATGFIAADGTYSIPDVPDGDFILEIPRMPGDFSKMAQMTPKEREPYCRKPIKVEGGKDVTVPDIRIEEDRSEPGPGGAKQEPKTQETPPAPPGE